MVKFYAASEVDSSKSDAAEKDVPSLFGALGLIKKTPKLMYKKRGWCHATTALVMFPLWGTLITPRIYHGIAFIVPRLPSQWIM